MPKRWTEQEKKNLFTHYPAIGTKELTRLFPTRTEMAIYKAALQFGVKKNHDRLAEQGRENVAKRKDRQCAFTEPPAPSC